jgi:hypothetical protein
MASCSTEIAHCRAIIYEVRAALRPAAVVIRPATAALRPATGAGWPAHGRSGRGRDLDLDRAAVAHGMSRRVDLGGGPHVHLDR